VDNVILDLNLCLFLFVFKAKSLNILPLFFQLDLLVCDLALQYFELVLSISKLVLGQLDLSLGGCSHRGHLLLVILELFLNELDLTVCVLSDLTHSLLVVSLHCLNILIEVSDLLIFFPDGFLVIILLSVDFIGMLIQDGKLGILEFLGLLLLLFLQSLVTGSILEHFG
jgi:hypothetical protein